MRHVLLLDDDINVLHALRRALRQCAPGEELSVEIFTNPFEALTRCCAFNFDLVVSDQCMPQMSGIDFLNALRDAAPTTVRMMLSASTEFETALGAINQAQVFRYIAKPWQTEQLREAIALALQLRERLLEQRERDLTPQEIEARRLEAEEPGITSVKWGPDGSVIL